MSSDEVGPGAMQRVRAGIELAQRGEVVEALACFGEAAALDPDSPVPWYSMGLTFRAVDRVEEAIQAYRRALEVQPNHPDSLINLGVLIASSGDPVEAVTLLEAALKGRPDDPSILNNLGSACVLALRLDEARHWYDRALELRSGDADILFNRSQMDLLLGDLSRGLVDFESRFFTRDRKNPGRTCAAPRWRGEDLEGRSMFLFPEGGLGDSIQFVRYIPLLKRRGATVLLEAPFPLRRLFEKVDGVQRVLIPGSAIPPTDFHCPLMSLAAGFGTTLENIPSDVPYITAPPGFRPTPGELHVGVAWAGNPRNRLDQLRSLPPSLLAPLAGVTGVRFHRLQLPTPGKGSEPVPLSFATQVEDGQDFAATAGLVAHLDLVITVDSAVAHLAGALGRPVWTLLPFSPDWRWFLDREDSPWYPTMRLFRQPRPGDWPPVIEAVGRELVTLVTRRSSPVAPS